MLLHFTVNLIEAIFLYGVLVLIFGVVLVGAIIVGLKVMIEVAKGLVFSSNSIEKVKKNIIESRKDNDSIKAKDVIIKSNSLNEKNNEQRVKVSVPKMSR